MCGAAAPPAGPLPGYVRKYSFAVRIFGLMPLLLVVNLMLRRVEGLHVYDAAGKPATSVHSVARVAALLPVSAATALLLWDAGRIAATPRSRCLLALLTAALTCVLPVAVLSSFSQWCALRRSDLTLMCDMLGTVATQLDAANVTYWLTLGTALAAIRDGRLSPFEHDVDICIDREQSAVADRAMRGGLDTRRMTATWPYKHLPHKSFTVASADPWVNAHHGEHAPAIDAWRCDAADAVREGAPLARLEFCGGRSFFVPADATLHRMLSNMYGPSYMTPLTTNRWGACTLPDDWDAPPRVGPHSAARARIDAFAARAADWRRQGACPGCLPPECMAYPARGTVWQRVAQWWGARGVGFDGGPACTLGMLLASLRGDELPRSTLAACGFSNEKADCSAVSQAYVQAGTGLGEYYQRDGA